MAFLSLFWPSSELLISLDTYISRTISLHLGISDILLWNLYLSGSPRDLLYFWHIYLSSIISCRLELYISQVSYRIYALSIGLLICILLLVFYEHSETIIYWGLNLLEDLCIGTSYLEPQYHIGTFFPKNFSKSVFHIQKYILEHHCQIKHIYKGLSFHDLNPNIRTSKFFIYILRGYIKFGKICF